MNGNDLMCLYAAVVAMRKQQRAYFAGDRSLQRLAAAKDAEKRVDALLESFAADVVDLTAGQERLDMSA